MKRYLRNSSSQPSKNDGPSSEQNRNLKLLPSKFNDRWNPLRSKFHSFIIKNNDYLLETEQAVKFYCLNYYCINGLNIMKANPDKKTNKNYKSDTNLDVADDSDLFDDVDGYRNKE